MPVSYTHLPHLFERDGGILCLRLLCLPGIGQAVLPDPVSYTHLDVYKRQGLHVVMLTGDNRVTAEAIRKEVGVEEAISDVLPADKEASVRALQEKGHKVAMVGDGVNEDVYKRQPETRPRQS